jgi:DNA-binding response OmpR family regulator
MRDELSDSPNTVVLFEESCSSRESVRLGLVQFGFRVIEASNADEVVSVCRRQKERVDLAVIELAAPNYRGRRVADRLSTGAPNLPIVAISDQTWDVLYNAGALSLDDTFFQKPMYPCKLADAIYTLLGAPNPIRPQSAPVCGSSRLQKVRYSLFGSRNIAFL